MDDAQALFLKKISIACYRAWGRPLRKHALVCLKRSEALPVRAAQLSACLRLGRAEAERSWRWCQAAPHRRVLFFAEEDYPACLGHIPDPPLCLWVEGDVAALHALQLAVVGTRNPTPHGLALVQQFVRPLASSGVVITSGLALGVDGEAHRAALKVGGRTVAVLGSGLQCIYPKRHAALAKAIVRQEGALVSPFFLESPPLRGHFPARNRIISGLSQSVLVVEAGMPSGTLLTAQYALEQGRDVLALPGSLSNPKSRGCHHLIQQGAALVMQPEDVLASLATGLALDSQEKEPVVQLKTPAQLDASGVKLLECTGLEGSTLEQLVRLSRLSVHEVSTLLAAWEEEGCIALSGGLYIRCMHEGSRRSGYLDFEEDV